MNAKIGTSPLATAISFIDCINRGDVAGLAALMHEDHELQIFDEAAVVGREPNRTAWHSYASSYPDYLILPRRMSEAGSVAGILGHTTGSHLALPDDEESKLTLIWLCELREGKVLRWALVPDNAENRGRFGLDE
jgi:hypothetical protein